MLKWQEKAINKIDRMSDSQLFDHILVLGDDRWKAKNHEERETLQWEWNRAITGFRSRMRLYPSVGGSPPRIKLQAPGKKVKAIV